MTAAVPGRPLDTASRIRRAPELRPVDPSVHTDTVWELARARDLAALGRVETTRAWIEGRLTAPGTDPARDARLCPGPGGEAVGAAWVGRTSGVAGWVVELALGPRAAQADATALLDFAVARCRASLGGDDGAERATLSCFTSAGEDLARTTLRDHGFGLPRAYHRMAVALDGPLADRTGASGVPGFPGVPVVPGAMVRPLRDEADLRAFHHAKNQAYAADEAGKEEDSFDSWARWYRSDPGVDPSQCALLELDGRVVGFVNVTDRMLESRGVAYVRQLGIDPSARGRGLGGVLLGWAMGEARRRGRAGMVLTVDEENVRARALYRRLGWRVESRWDDVRRTVAPAAPAARRP
ncbi:GNAT family N-acetyltransferase [Streptomyces sp. NPDC048717]|uniref:GNAT family N-acetyltransferase n=1 Tax=Streptomyces sp. NPDC048717 TaxID=3154928 RepID=UPI003428E2FC